MKISFNWLKNYIQTDLSVHDISSILTSTGLEVESVEPFETVRGGLEGIVIGEVLSCRKHPDADKLTITEVNVGSGQTLQIICGAPNVAPGQKVPVALVGATLYNGDESFTIRNAKIRGVPSEGMICAEDEIGLGTSHEGIMVLDPQALPGTPAREYFGIETDYTMEIGLTPNRIDAASHIGVARDLQASLSLQNKGGLITPSVEAFKPDSTSLHIPVEIENPEACYRYAGVTISGAKVAPSPKWLQNRLLSIGQRPINNVVDITNFVLHETGQPLHAFNADTIRGGKVIVRTLPDNTVFTTLDEVERKLAGEDLMICNTEGGMCIAGVFGGIESGVDENTRNIFLESACFSPAFIRRTSRRHGLFTDASFRFERGVDPNITVYALKRAALLIRELTGGSISSEVVDVYPNPIPHFDVTVSLNNISRLAGVEIDRQVIRTILKALDIEIEKESDDLLLLNVPPYRVDVRREADVIEEILRIYGFDNVPVSARLVSSISPSTKPDKDRLTNLVADMLSSQGFHEMMSNSLTRSSYYEHLKTWPKDHLVYVLNPLSQDLNCVRQTLVFGVLESIVYNQNRKNPDLRLYEFGNCYSFHPDRGEKGSLDRYTEEEQLCLAISGDYTSQSWNSPQRKSDIFIVKGHLEGILRRLGILPEDLKMNPFSSEIYSEGAEYLFKGKKIASFGTISRTLQKDFDIRNEVFIANLNWTAVFGMLRPDSVSYSEIPKFPEVKRDLAMVLDKNISFNEIRNLAFAVERNLLKKVFIFDVYEGDKIEQGKKSYAVSFILQDTEKTLTDFQIDKIMDKLVKTYETNLNATIRK
jgi:phenylalanyl-tRNA synthetase beta chain